MTASKVQILELISWLTVKVSLEFSIFNDDFDIQEGNAGGANAIIVGFEDHPEFVVVTEIQEFIVFEKMYRTDEEIAQQRTCSYQKCSCREITKRTNLVRNS